MGPTNLRSTCALTALVPAVAQWCAGSEQHHEAQHEAAEEARFRRLLCRRATAIATNVRHVRLRSSRLSTPSMDPTTTSAIPQAGRLRFRLKRSWE